ncbi:MAG: hypothetical protein Q8R15_03035 [Candidatus Micrarchaeota archaeon]|nr:hypothetical protein [Candidatus Micrarchaeota archaeon]
MFLGYSEIFGRAAGLKKNVQNWFIVLSRNEPSSLRLKALESLARLERSTISNVLKQLKENRTGGTYLSVAAFFNKLENENVLMKEEVGRRTYWQFSHDAEDLKKYLLITGTGKWMQNK